MLTEHRHVHVPVCETTQALSVVEVNVGTIWPWKVKDRFGLLRSAISAIAQFLLLCPCSFLQCPVMWGTTKKWRSTVKQIFLPSIFKLLLAPQLTSTAHSERRKGVQLGLAPTFMTAPLVFSQWKLTVKSNQIKSIYLSTNQINRVDRTPRKAKPSLGLTDAPASASAACNFHFCIRMLQGAAIQKLARTGHGVEKFSRILVTRACFVVISLLSQGLRHQQHQPFWHHGS